MSESSSDQSAQSTGADLPAARASTVVRAIYAMSVFSGAAAMIYQVAWVKMLSLSLGNTTLAAGAVIGSFMAGMGIGARCYDMISRRYRNPIRLYAILELGIAATTFAITLSLYALPQLYADVYRSIESHTLLSVIRFASVFFLLLVPAALMGATFPALCSGLIRSAKGLGRHLGMIYGLNTLGAAAGSVAAGFLLIELVGNRASVWTANLVNLAVALSALWLSTRVEASDSRDPIATEETALTSRLPKFLVAAVLVWSGFATLCYEIFWIRGLKYVVGNSTYAISMVLVMFLTGLGLGGLLLRRVIRRRQPEHDLGLCQLAIALLALSAVGLEAFMLTNPWLANEISIFSTKVMAAPWTERLFLAAIASIVLLLPPTICMGLSFPLASRLFVEDAGRIGRGVGTAYLLANMGSIAGVICAASFLLPALGTAGATKLVSVINIVLGLSLLIYLGGWTRGRLASAVISVGGVLALSLVLPSQIPFRGEFESESDNTKLLFWDEGDIGTVKIIEFGPGAKAMTIDGYVIGSEGAADVVTYKQKLLAHFPMLLVPNAKKSLNIGLGSGTTLATLASYDKLKLLDCVEIVPGVVRGAQLMESFQQLDDDRVHIHVDDAVHFLLTTDTTYDLIVADGKQNPKFAGNAAVLSEEFHQYCLDHLAEDGVLIEWLSLTMPPRAFQVAVRSFSNVFPHVAAYYFTPTAFALIGSKRPIGDNPQEWPTSFESKTARADLDVFAIESPLSLMASRISDGSAMKLALGAGEVNTWDHPILEFIAYKEFHVEDDMSYGFQNLALFRGAKSSGMDRFLEAIPLSQNSQVANYIRSTRLLQQGFVKFFETKGPRVFQTACEQALRVNPNDSMAASVQAKLPYGLQAVVHPRRLQ